MQSNTESLNSLERKISISIPQADVRVEVDNRLKKLSGKVKLPGFRPGKVPLKMVIQQYGLQLHQEVLGELVQKYFRDSVQKQDLRIAGSPNFSSKSLDQNSLNYEFDAVFEVYPEIIIGDFSGLNVSRPSVQIEEVEVEKTLDTLRKQRAKFEVVDRPARKGDRVNIDYHGQVDGKEFEGGQAKGFNLILGDGYALKDFEDAIIDMKNGENKVFQMTFPADYHGKEVAGKSVTFDVRLNKVEEQLIPSIDTDFAKSLGISDGDISKMYAEVKASIEREVLQRIRSKLKEQVMQFLLESINCGVPQVLVSHEIEHLIQEANNNLKARGLADREANLSPDLFRERAERRVKLGLILAKLIEQQGIKVQSDQLRKYVEEYAKSYEDPEQVIHWYYSSPERLKDIESLVLEDNVVSWILERAHITDQQTAFDDLMGYAKQ
ncbi:MAG: trigger factor [Nitrosomonas sp.]|nr:trigger factor [Nitrosomonas sp.]